MPRKRVTDQDRAALDLIDTIYVGGDLYGVFLDRRIKQGEGVRFRVVHEGKFVTSKKEREVLEAAYLAAYHHLYQLRSDLDQVRGFLQEPSRETRKRQRRRAKEDLGVILGLIAEDEGVNDAT